MAAMSRGVTHIRTAVVAMISALMLIGLVVLSQTAGGESKTEFTLPGSESQAAFDLLQEHGFSNRAGEQAQIVFEADQGVNDPAVREAMESLFATVEQEVTDALVLTSVQSVLD